MFIKSFYIKLCSFNNFVQIELVLIILKYRLYVKVILNSNQQKRLNITGKAEQSFIFVFFIQIPPEMLAFFIYRCEFFATPPVKIKL